MSQVRWTAYEGKQLVEQWEKSGMDKSAFCKEHGIAYGRFLYWCNRIRDSDDDSSGTSGLVQLEIVPDLPAGKLSISGANGLILHLDAREHSLSFIKALLTA